MKSKENKPGLLDRYKTDPEFLEKVSETIATEQFQRLKKSIHHHDSVYDHTLRVTYKAYKMGKRWKANEKELLRSALFHDLYFHDWREREYLFNHGWSHPKIALKNAQEHFGPLTEREVNAISGHMWPFNFTNPPRYKEAFIVALADKWVATAEVLLMFLNPIRSFTGKESRKG